MKFCEKCGSQLEDGVKFCTNCGAAAKADGKPEEDVIHQEIPEAPAPEIPEAPVEPAPAIPAPEAPAYAYAPAPAPAAPEAAPVKKSKKKPLVFAGIAAAAVLVIAAVCAAVFILMSKGSAKILTGGPDGSGNTVIVNTDGKITTLTDINSKYSIKISLNGKKAVIYTSSDGDNGLYYYNGKEAKKIILTDENIDNWLISNNGNKVVYSHAGAIYSYENGKSTKIAENAVLCAISPDGKTVAYYTDNGEEVSGYYYNGKEQSLGKSVKPFAVSNGAKLVYYTKRAYSGEENTYVQKGNDETERVKLYGEDNYNYYVSFNADMTEIMFTKNGGTYISKNGNDPEKISSDAYYVDRFAGSGVKSAITSYYSCDRQYVFVYDEDSFDGVILRNDDSKISIYTKGELKNLINYSYNECKDVGITEDTKTLFYIKDEAIYKKNIMTPDAEPVKVVDDVSSIKAISDDGSAVAYLNTDNEYMFKKGNSKPVRIADYGEIEQHFAIYKGKLYYIMDAELYSTSDGKSKKPVKVDGDSQVSFVSSAFGLLVVSSESDTEEKEFLSTNGSSFELVMASEKTGY